MGTALQASKRNAALHPDQSTLRQQLLDEALRAATRPNLLQLPPRSALPSLSLVCCSVKPEIETRWRGEVARHFADWAQIETCVLNDARSLAEAYNRGAERTRGEWLVFCHDDIRFARPDFAARVASAMHEFDVFGPAGSVDANALSALWAGPRSGFAQVAYPLPDGRWLATIGGIGAVRQAAKLLDGVFIAVRRSVWERVRFDATRFDAFHLYDMDFSLCCDRAGARVGIAQDLHLVHDSLGDFDATWSGYAERFVEKHPDLVIGEANQDPTGGIAVDDFGRISALFDAINAA